MTADRVSIVDQAIAWHLRLAEADETGWAAFVAWLEADPAHAEAYDRLAAGDRLLDAATFSAAPAPVADNDNPAGPRRWWWALGAGGAVAAALSVVALQPGLLKPPSSAYVVATANGERKTVTLGDGTRIELGGGTAIRLDRADDRVASLERGEAVFHVRHDPARPFTVDAAGVAVRDLGTVFDLAVADTRIHVAVAEGSVMVAPEREALRLGAGDAVALDRGSGRIARSRLAPELVGGWRTGSLSFDGARVGDVAAALTRLYGTELALAPNLSNKPFTGMVRFTGAADRDVPHLAELIGATSRREGNRWILSEAP
ncbi:MULTISPECIES: FecR domain-containing protein [unclassified Sphingomonas]|uniref:FecR family protein n=1 Tax=Sphingomonas TaxID=13687 RepID=UPI000960834D|nr:MULTISPECIES: FecR domain-containing protein [unclassified Sphingomonas]MBN8811072.1 FecR domain-containing protein [Sphingomonas sp.]OJY54555.1 MAG: Fe2+-dicitrate sensor membrane component [Sphingomonas sp. 67-41]